MLPVIRMHTMSIEQAILLQAAKKSVQTGHRNTVRANTRGSAADHFDTIMLGADSDGLRRRKSGIADKRLKLERLSLGRWMARRLGVHGPTKFLPLKLDALLRLGPKVANGAVLGREEKVAFEADLKTLREDVKKRAAVLVLSLIHI